MRVGETMNLKPRLESIEKFALTCRTYGTQFDCAQCRGTRSQEYDLDKLTVDEPRTLRNLLAKAAGQASEEKDIMR